MVDRQKILDLNRKIFILKSKLTVRDCQYEVAIEGLKTIIESNDPMGVAQKTLDAIMDCLPK